MYTSSPIEQHDFLSSDGSNTSLKKSIGHATHTVESKGKRNIVNVSAEGPNMNKKMDHEMMLNNKDKNNGNGTCDNAQASCSNQDTPKSSKRKRTSGFFILRNFS